MSRRNDKMLILAAGVFSVVALAWTARRMRRAPNRDPGDTEARFSNSERVLFISLELGDPLFSGNGVYSRTILGALMSTLQNAQVLALCGLPPGPTSPASVVHLDPSRVLKSSPETVAKRLRVRAVRLAKWGSLDITSDWEGFQAAARVFEDDVRAFSPTLVLYVDWTGSLLARALFPQPKACNGRASDQTCSHLPQMAYLNFRVFAANTVIKDNGAHAPPGTAPGGGSSTEGGQGFYATKEGEALLHADVTLALCPADADSLDQLGERAFPALALPRTFVLNPPLREDLRRLAATAAAAGGEEVRGNKTRRWLLCVSRLSPEKNVELFVAAVASAGCGRLNGLGVVPRLVGSGPDVAYVSKIRRSLLDVCPDAVGIHPLVDLLPILQGKLLADFAMGCSNQVVEDFNGDPKFLADLFSSAVLNLHPAIYEAYG